MQYKVDQPWIHQSSSPRPSPRPAPKMPNFVPKIIVFGAGREPGRGELEWWIRGQNFPYKLYVVIWDRECKNNIF